MWEILNEIKATSHDRLAVVGAEATNIDRLAEERRRTIEVVPVV